MLKKIVIFALIINGIIATHNMKVVYKWKSIDYQFDSNATREEALRNGSFVPENIVILGLEVFEDRVFITTPSWRLGVWSTLNFIYTNDSSISPKLIPYPNSSIHQSNPPDIVSPYRPRQDTCGRLWVPDTGLYDYLGQLTRYGPALHVFNLTTNERIMKYIFPNDVITDQAYFATLALEVLSCDDIYAYIGDIKLPSLIVYSLKENKSWKIKHSYFERNPFAGDYNVAGVNFRWNEGIFGVALSDLRPDNFSTLYFLPMTSFDTFQVSTEILRDPSLANRSYYEFKYLGSRGRDTQVGPAAFDKKSGTLFYGMFNRNAVACWNSKLPVTEDTQGIVHEDDTEMITPADMVINKNDLWAVSDKLPIFMFSKLNFSEYNFRIFKSSIGEAVHGTVCDVKAKNSGFLFGPSSILKLIIASFFILQY